MIMCGLCIYAGGGGTREGLSNEMHKLGKTCLKCAFLATACYYHGSNLVIASPCEKYFGNGSISNCNPFQLLCTCYAIQKLYDMDAFRKI